MDNQLGLVTLHTRVERWECDHNQHWNTRFYARTFQEASDTLAARFCDSVSRISADKHFLVRFYRELKVLDVMTVRSARFGDSTIHFLLCDEQVAATAIDFRLCCESLPTLTDAEAAVALPRGLTESTSPRWQPSDLSVCTELGVVRRHEFDDSGGIMQDVLVRYCAVPTTVFMNRIGMTSAWMQQQKLGFMAAELSIEVFTPITSAMVLRACSRVGERKQKSMIVEHLLMNQHGVAVAVLRIVQLCVNLETRKVTSIPISASIEREILACQ